MLCLVLLFVDKFNVNKLENPLYVALGRNREAHAPLTHDLSEKDRAVGSEFECVPGIG